MGYLLDKWDFLYYLYKVIKKPLQGNQKTKRACELFVKGAREVVEVVDYSITNTK